MINLHERDINIIDSHGGSYSELTEYGNDNHIIVVDISAVMMGEKVDAASEELDNGDEDVDPSPPFLLI